MEASEIMIKSWAIKRNLAFVDDEGRNKVPFESEKEGDEKIKKRRQCVWLKAFFLNKQNHAEEKSGAVLTENDRL